jgi:hypothetical protein
MKRKSIMIAMAMMFMIAPLAMACEDYATLDTLKTFLSWDKTDMLDNGTLSSELSSTMAANAYDNNVPMGIVKFYNPEEKVGYYFAYTVDEAGVITYIDAENDMVYTSMETAKQRLAYRGIDFTNVIYSEYFPDLDAIDGTMDNTIPSNIIVN